MNLSPAARYTISQLGAVAIVAFVGAAVAPALKTHPLIGAAVSLALHQSTPHVAAELRRLTY